MVHKDVITTQSPSHDVSSSFIT